MANHFKDAVVFLIVFPLLSSFLSQLLKSHVRFICILDKHGSLLRLRKSNCGDVIDPRNLMIDSLSVENKLIDS